MSQRLHIGVTDDKWYDCVITEAGGAYDKLVSDWVCLGPTGCFLGPWRITIGDRKLFDLVHPDIRRLFARLGHPYPDCVWTFCADGQETLDHPTETELHNWLNLAAAT